MQTLFQYINPKDNTQLSQLSHQKLKQLLIKLQQYKLEYRTSLALPQEVTFGVEIEFGCTYQDNIRYQYLQETLETYTKQWELKKEITNCGLEIASNILTDQKKTWRLLKQVCQMTKHYGKETPLSGGHVHVGAHLFQNDTQCFNFIKLLTAYENMLYRFGYGEYYGADNRLIYALPMREVWEEAIKYKHSSFPICIAQSTSQSVNLKAFFQDYKTMRKDNTIEFRFPNGTLNPIIWQNNINVFTKMMLYIQKGDINQDILNHRIYKNHKLKPIMLQERYQQNQFPLQLINIEQYESIDLEQALEFSDLIFQNNLDKLYFLKQYIKDGKTSKNKVQKVKNLTR